MVDAVKQPERPKLIQVMGPGLITGASDDDPSGIATYSQVGAKFGFAMGWTLLFSYPLMAAIQEISARIGRVTGHGIAGNLARHYPRWLVRSLVGLLVLANVVNIGADLGAMGDALKLLIGGPAAAYVALFAVVSVLLEVFLRYARYVTILKWLTLSLLAYVGTVFVVKVPWGAVLHDLVVPHIQLNGEYLTAIVAVLGTTISPYLFFWQAGEEVDEEREHKEAKPLKVAPEQAPEQLQRIRLDTYIGMGASNLVALFIVITAGATLHATGVTDIESSAQAAEALRPVAGPFAFVIFALGIIGTGMLALPVLAGSAAYAVGEVQGWRVGLAQKPRRARAFYGTIAAATAVGAAMNFSQIDPIQALFWSAVVNGVVAVPVMVMMLLLVRKPKVMGEFTITGTLAHIGWLAAAVMAAAVVAMVVSLAL